MLGEILDPQAETLIYEHCRPHWSQAGAVAFITFRTHESIPRAVIDRWDHKKYDWLARRGHGSRRHWSHVLPALPDKERAAFQQHFQRCREDFLATCQGESPLRRPELARIVAEYLYRPFDDDGA